MRKAISKKLRFEVFKRDSFKCQYCGQHAPNVILQVDHINPVSKGGKNNIMNLITSCFDCNSGKRDTILSDETVLIKQKNQMDTLQERANQIKMMSDWHTEMMKQEDQVIDLIDKKIKSLFGCTMTDYGKVLRRRDIRNFGVTEVMNAIDIAYKRYYHGTTETAEDALTKVGGICYNRKHNIKYK